MCCWLDRRKETVCCDWIEGRKQCVPDWIQGKKQSVVVGYKKESSVL